MTRLQVQKSPKKPRTEGQKMAIRRKAGQRSRRLNRFGAVPPERNYRRKAY